MNTNLNFALERIKKSFEIQSEAPPKNKYIVLYRAIKACIVNVELPHNWLLPSTRILAKEMGVSRTTVLKAYELLLLEKLIIAKAGSGYKVFFEKNQKSDHVEQGNNSFDKNLYPSLSVKGNAFLKNVSLINTIINDTGIAFRPGLPPLDVFPINQWKNLLNTYWRYVKSSGLNYSRATGIDSLKKSICDYLNISRNIKCDYKQIVVVSGSLQSLYLVSNALINKDDHVVLEDPTFPNVHSIFKSIQATLLPIPLDDEGISMKHIDSINHLKPKIVHTTPSDHYPLGVKMSLNRRKELLQWASKNKALIIENDYEHEIGNTFKYIPSIYSLDTEDRTIYMGTFNRLLHPSIRLGYMIVPEYLTNAIEALLLHSHRFVAPSIQTVMNQFIERNYLYQHLKNISEVAQERQLLFLEEFKKSNKTMTIKTNTFASLHLIAKFNKHTTEKDEIALVDKLSDANITAHSLSKCYIGNEKQQGLILGYSSVRPAVLKQKARKLVKLIQ
ncbi:PLP-dependent aminotransferase family protein [Algibacter sp. 2305UL17-15]|uniref:MocR-like pyridoxine biosynthesis transcription factor PdxR n=1 Tax=Algibacter sp. 2305UL17-15 TaxID=3231268 RepID=UPI003459E05F